MRILSETIPGQVQNVYTAKDLILILYSISQTDWAMGRNPMFVKQKQGERENMIEEDPNKAEFASLSVVAQPHQQPFTVKNYSIWSLNPGHDKNYILGIGHMQYRAQLDLILHFIDFRL